MSIKEIIANMTEKRNEKRKKFHEMEEEFLMQKKLEDKQKSANERELERFMKEKREEAMKKQLERFRKEKQEEFWHGHQILDKGKGILKDDKPILKQKNVIGLFSKTKNSGSVFWGW